MRIDEQIYVSPFTHTPLKLEIVKECDGVVISGNLHASDGSVFGIDEGVPDLTYPPVLHPIDRQALDFYNGRADVYDKYLHLTFETFWEDEKATRNQIIDTLELKPDQRVLEVSCGSGRDSELIASRLNAGGRLYLQDISRPMLERCIGRLGKTQVPVEFCVSNACYLPYPDGFFDAVYHFGGLGEFSDIGRALREMTRVTKVGGRVVAGDESMPPWLRGTRFAKIMTTTNPQFDAKLPLEHIPVEARNFRLRWIIGGVFYLIDFVVGSGEPTGNFNYEIPGPRGGTHLTRVDGQLEGVKVETKDLALKAAAKTGKSMHAWLDEVVRNAAGRDLER